MDLSLALTFSQLNDNKTVVLTDTTTNWGSSTTNLTAGDTTVLGDFYEIVASTTDFTAAGIDAPDNNVGTRFVIGSAILLAGTDDLIPVTPALATEIDTLTLDTIVTGVSEVADTKDQVDLLTEFGAFATQADMVYNITALLLGDTSGSELEDGLYAFTYTVTYSGDGIVNTKTDILSTTILVYGQIKVTVYEKLRSISTLYMCKDSDFKEELSEADLCGAYLSSIEASAYVAKTEELLDMLVVLTNLVTNGSNITW